VTDSASVLVALVDALDDPVLDRLATRLAPRLRASEHGVQPAAYTVATLAQALALSPRAIRGAIERGELAAIKRGGRWIIAAQAVAAWAEPRHEETTTPALPRPRTRTTRGATLAAVVRSLDADDEDR
jgi:excisionase family DNA binding protein